MKSCTANLARRTGARMRNLLCVPGMDQHTLSWPFPGVPFQGWHAPVPSYGLGATVTAQHMPGIWREGGIWR